jgi:hypothetical protein
MRPVGTADAQPFAIEKQFADLWMIEAEHGPLLPAHFIAGPELCEEGTGQGKLTDELDEPGVLDVGADGLAEIGDEALRDVFPLRLQCLLRRVQEHVHELVSPGVPIVARALWRAGWTRGYRSSALR